MLMLEPTASLVYLNNVFDDLKNRLERTTNDSGRETKDERYVHNCNICGYISGDRNVSESCLAMSIPTGIQSVYDFICAQLV